MDKNNVSGFFMCLHLNQDYEFSITIMINEIMRLRRESILRI